MLSGELVHRRKERVILRRIYVWDARLEIRELQIPHFFPVNYLGEEVETKTVDKSFDIVDRNL